MKNWKERGHAEDHYTGGSKLVDEAAAQVEKHCKIAKLPPNHNFVSHEVGHVVEYEVGHGISHVVSHEIHHGVGHRVSNGVGHCVGPSLGVKYCIVLLTHADICCVYRSNLVCFPKELLEIL